MGDIEGVTPISALMDDIDGDHVLPFLKYTCPPTPAYPEEPLYLGQPLGGAGGGTRVFYWDAGLDTLSLFQGPDAVYANAGKGVSLTLPQPAYPTWDRYFETWAAYLAYEFAMGALETDNGFVHDALVGPQI